jgi:Fe-S cluster biogenesis protein NfuA/nitrite reductase/ring-hydroxylating ferredoxin subunit
MRASSTPEPSAHVEELLGRVEELSDPAARELALATVQALLELYGEGLRRMLDAVGPTTAAELAGDDLVGHLLLLHGLHPVGVRERVQAALDGVRPYLGSHGGDVELVGVEDGVARVRLQGSCDGCPASAMTLKLAIEDAVLEAAPEVERVEADTGGAAAPAPAPLLQIQRSPSPPKGAWTMAGAMPQLARDGALLRRVGGRELLFLALEGDTYAYAPDCPGCGASLGDGALAGAELACPACGHRYDARRAGRCLDEPGLQLTPVPLLVDDSGLVRVAVPTEVA